eukprot:gb/GECG01015927.1/.p1 GENE.gb/GECG01015927.1/~~gb/GECG01015927.1/.p1  ORF type:complete len:201 (+),score=23.10 gb/GECG01015927.1/:1-603(+)
MATGNKDDERNTEATHHASTSSSSTTMRRRSVVAQASSNRRRNSSSSSSGRRKKPQERHDEETMEVDTVTEAPSNESNGILWVPAGVGIRTLAVLVELLILVGVYIGALIIMDGRVSLALLIGVITMELYLFAKGTRIGKYCLGIHVINTETHEPAGFIQTFSRESMVLVSLVLDIFLYFCLRQRLCDRLLQTRVMKHAH